MGHGLEVMVQRKGVLCLGQHVENNTEYGKNIEKQCSIFIFLVCGLYNILQSYI